MGLEAINAVSSSIGGGVNSGLLFPMTATDGPSGMLFVKRERSDDLSARFLCPVGFYQFRGARDSSVNERLAAALRRDRGAEVKSVRCGTGEAGSPCPSLSRSWWESGSSLSSSVAKPLVAMSWSMVMSLSGPEPRLDGRSRPNGPRGRGKGEPRSRSALERRRQRMRVGHRDGSASPGLPAMAVRGRKEDRTALASAPPAPIQPWRRKPPGDVTQTRSRLRREAFGVGPGEEDA
jgi:hypothetical protein